MNPAMFDALGAGPRWCAQGVAPDQILASCADTNKIHQTWPACPYPQVLIYMGSGDTRGAANFRCGIPTW